MSATLLATGILGAVSLVDGANRTTSITRARERATNLARTVLEAAHTVPYSQLTKTGVASALSGQPGLPADSDSWKPGWQIARGPITYTVDVNECTVDDQRDGTGDDDSEYCAPASASNPPDTRPADYKRVSATISWSDIGGPHTLAESDVIGGSYRGPSATSLTTNVASPVTTSLTGIDFQVTATAGTSQVKWSLDGNEMGTATKTGSTWTFTWNLGSPTGSLPCNASAGGTLDGTYIVSADAYDSSGLSENGRALTMQINRCPPMPVSGLEGGNTKLWPGMELQWDESSEEDVIGYYVYRSTVGSTGPWARVTPGLSPDSSQPDCGGLVTEANCVTADVLGQKEWYCVSAVDKAPDGTQREGDKGPAILVDPANNAQGKPGPGVDSAFPYSLKWGGKAVSNPPPADYVDFYYIYRDTNGGRPDRYDSIDNTGGTIYWTDPDPGTGSHTYWVTTVDNHLAESGMAPGNGITLP